MIDKEFDLFQDIYYQKAYSELYLCAHDSLFEFIYEESEKKIVFRSIKRPITHVAQCPLDAPFYDLESHYGYGGPLSTSTDPQFLQRAFLAYRKKCAEEQIVCEFIRFHPYNHLGHCAAYFDFHMQEREVVTVDLSCDTTQRWSSYTKTARNVLRKAQKNLGVEINQRSLDEFYPLYTQTMDKNSADDFYYFSPDYFKNLVTIGHIELLSIAQHSTLISGAYFMYGPDLAHYHLAASNAMHIKEGGNYLLLDAAFDRAKALGCKAMLLGGGRTSSAQDSLYLFKRHFSKNTLPFYIAGLNFLPEIKKQLDTLWHKQYPNNTTRYFQQYRQLS